MNAEIDEPIDMVQQSLGKIVVVKCKNDRELRGKLHV
jgi:small nuclear ribonucleoprotein (snRNP)-like protein